MRLLKLVGVLSLVTVLSTGCYKSENGENNPINLFDEYQGDIDALVNRRNSIAHGNFRAGVTEREFSNWESKVSEILSGVTRLLYDYANNERYLV